MPSVCVVEELIWINEEKERCLLRETVGHFLFEHNNEEELRNWCCHAAEALHVSDTQFKMSFLSWLLVFSHFSSLISHTFLRRFQHSLVLTVSYPCSVPELLVPKDACCVSYVKNMFCFHLMSIIRLYQVLQNSGHFYMIRGFSDTLLFVLFWKWQTDIGTLATKSPPKQEIVFLPGLLCFQCVISQSPFTPLSWPPMRFMLRLEWGSSEEAVQPVWRWAYFQHLLYRDIKGCCCYWDRMNHWCCWLSILPQQGASCSSSPYLLPDALQSSFYTVESRVALQRYRKGLLFHDVTASQT